MNIKIVMELGLKNVLNFHITYYYKGTTVIQCRKTKKILRIMHKNSLHGANSMVQYI